MDKFIFNSILRPGTYDRNKGGPRTRKIPLRYLPGQMRNKSNSFFYNTRGGVPTRGATEEVAPGHLCVWTVRYASVLNGQRPACDRRRKSEWGLVVFVEAFSLQFAAKVWRAEHRGFAVRKFFENGCSGIAAQKAFPDDTSTFRLVKTSLTAMPIRRWAQALEPTAIPKTIGRPRTVSTPENCQLSKNYVKVFKRRPHILEEHEERISEDVIWLYPSKCADEG